MEFINSGATIFITIVVIIIGFVAGLSTIDFFGTKDKEPREKAPEQPE